MVGGIEGLAGGECRERGAARERREREMGARASVGGSQAARRQRGQKGGARARNAHMADTVSMMPSRLPAAAAIASASPEASTCAAPSALASAALASVRLITVTSQPMATANLTAMWPRPPRPTTPTCSLVVYCWEGRGGREGGGGDEGGRQPQPRANCAPRRGCCRGRGA